jgi:hypothetical protein
VYEHEYQKGVVIHTGVFGSDLVPKDREMQFFLTAAVRRLASHTSPVITIPEFQLSEITLALTIGMSLAVLSYTIESAEKRLMIAGQRDRNAQFTHTIQIRIQEAISNIILILMA